MIKEVKAQMQLTMYESYWHVFAGLLLVIGSVGLYVLAIIGYINFVCWLIWHIESQFLYIIAAAFLTLAGFVLFTAILAGFIYLAQ